MTEPYLTRALETIAAAGYDHQADVLRKALHDISGGASLEPWVTAVFDNSVEHGWWNEKRNFLEALMLVVTETAEAAEDYRRHRPAYFETEDAQGNMKPEGWATELADVVIRVFDMAGGWGPFLNGPDPSREVPLLTFTEVVRRKMAYNLTRPHRHGGLGA
jgi:hypothetical protein